MAGAKRSRTAQGVTAERVILADMGVIDDPFAKVVLAASWRPFVTMVQHWPTSTPPWSVARAGLATRVLWHDAQLRASLDAGVQQVAVVGAGYDTRSWRLRREGVRFFELDHPATQADKRRRAPSPAPTYVEADLNNDDAGQALVRQGLDPAQPTHFIVEGVTMYLSEDVVRDQFAGLAAASGSGSRLSADFYPPTDAGTSQDRRLMRAQRLARAGSGETLRLHLDREQAGELIAGSGWDVEELTSLRTAALDLVSDRFGLPLQAINEHKTLAAGKRAQRP
jgi:methyltransferase (TIGR00027 family)